MALSSPNIVHWQGGSGTSRPARQTGKEQLERGLDAYLWIPESEWFLSRTKCILVPELSKMT